MHPEHARFVEQMGLHYEKEGHARSAGRLFGYLLLSDQERSLDELAEALGVSKASVSINARQLEQKGVVRRATRGSDRRDFYQAADDILVSTFEQRLQRWLELHQVVAAARQRIPAGPPTVARRLAAFEAGLSRIIALLTDALDDLRRVAAGSAVPRSKARR